MIRVEIDCEVISPNRLLAEHWRSRHHRRRRERAAIVKALNGLRPPPPPWLVTFTRCSASELDAHDGLPFAAKAFIDEIARWLGIDDRDPLVTWTYSQRKERQPARRRVTKLGTVPPRTVWRVWAEVTIETDAQIEPGYLLDCAPV